MQDATKTTLADLMKADSTQVNPLLANSVDEVVDVSETSTQSLTPPRIGQYWSGQGGIYAGIMRDGENQWCLILAAKEQGLIDTNWGKPGETIPGEFSRRDGQHNTALILAAEPFNEIATYITAIEIDGHRDFYWPSQCENNLLFANLPEHLNREWHWSSTQYSARYAWDQYFEDGDQGVLNKDGSLAARAVRRLVIE